MGVALCQCGCGAPTCVSKWTNTRTGAVAGQPLRYIHGHHRRGVKVSPVTRARMSAAQSGENHAHYGKRGAKAAAYKEGVIRNGGYVEVLVDETHRFFEMAKSVSGSWYIRRCRLALAVFHGRALLPEERAHHKWPCEGGSGDITDDRIENLVLFANQSVHKQWEGLLKKETA